MFLKSIIDPSGKNRTIGIVSNFSIISKSTSFLLKLDIHSRFPNFRNVCDAVLAIFDLFLCLGVTLVTNRSKKKLTHVFFVKSIESPKSRKNVQTRLLNFRRTQLSWGKNAIFFVLIFKDICL